MPSLTEEITAKIEGLDPADPEALRSLLSLTACLAASVSDLAEEVESGPRIRPAYSDAAAFATFDALTERKRRLHRSKSSSYQGDKVATQEALDQLASSIPDRLREAFGLDPLSAFDPLPAGFPESDDVGAPTSEKGGAE